MVPPVLSIAGGVAMVYLATTTPSALVVEDYARIEELTSERFARDREALRLALTAELRFEREAGRIEVFIDGPASVELPASLTLALRHATNPEADRKLRLARQGERFVVDTDLAPGRYDLELMPESQAWRLGAGTRRLDGLVVLRPQVDGA
jgi:hypothetical protein